MDGEHPDQEAYDEYASVVDKFLVSRQRGVRIWQVDNNALYQAFKSGTAPISFATQPHIPIQPPAVAPSPTPPTDPRSRQPQAVLDDARHQVNTGLDILCPACGSSNLLNKGKPDSGMTYFGSIGFVLAASVVDAAIMSKQEDVVQCNYCNNVFSYRTGFTRDQTKPGFQV